jgi:hypothetical protein
MEPATGDPRLHGVIIEADAQSGKALGIKRLSLSADELS